jgi:hypothetical protein
MLQGGTSVTSWAEDEFRVNLPKAESARELSAKETRAREERDRLEAIVEQRRAAGLGLGDVNPRTHPKTHKLCLRLAIKLREVDMREYDPRGDTFSRRNTDAINEQRREFWDSLIYDYQNVVQT